MLDQLTDTFNTIYNIVISFILEMDWYASLPETGGFLSIILLLLILKQAGKRRKQKKSEEIPASEPIADIEIDIKAAETKAEDLAEAGIEQPPDEFTQEIPVKDTETDPEIIGTELIDADEKETAKDEEEGKKDDVEPLPAKKAEPVGFMDRLKSGLSKTRQSLSNRFDSILSSSRKIDDDVLEEIEEVLITSDIGVPTTMELMQRIEKRAGSISNADEFKSALKKEMLSLVNVEYPEQPLEKPHIIMVVGVNGVGKTTTIGKLAAQFSAQGKKVLLAAADTFRAAAVEQLEIWANRSNADIVKHRDKSDPAAVAYDSVEAAIARDVDVVIVDTAGRLQTKINLMEELKKIKRSIGKRIPSAPHEILLVLDATTGQNAISQAKLFNESTDITGIVLTKLDGTAKGELF
jgi:fused signal recognition particle receptor